MNPNGQLTRNENSIAYMVLASSCAIALVLAGLGRIDLSQVTQSFQGGVLVIFVAMELFTSLIVSTGVMEIIAVKLSAWSKGHPLRIMGLFGGLLFLISALLNNLTAVLVVLPVLFVLLRGVRATRVYTIGLFSLLLAISNIGGAATPIGDFPAILIMKSGLTDFPNYLARAFPLFATTAVVVVGLHLLWVYYRNTRCERSEAASARLLGTHFLGVQYRYQAISWRELGILGGVFSGMFLGWSTLPADDFPPELIALAGLSLAAALTARGNGIDKYRSFDLKTVLTLSAFLLVASSVANSGILTQVAEWLQRTFDNPTALLMAVMLLTALLSGLFSAGPTTAAMLPIILTLAETSFHAHQEWLAVAFAVSICAGSSLFLWSATAGFLLQDKIAQAKLPDYESQDITWGIGDYLWFGVFHFVVQLAIGMAWVLIAIRA